MAFAEYSVLTPERVSLEYDIAGVGSRGAAAIVDTGIQLVALIVVLVALAAFSAISGLLGELRGESDLVYGVIIAVYALAVFVITAGYFMLFEILWNGQTPGKRLVGIRVIRENGYPMRPVDAVIRNVVRIVDWLPLFYGVGVLVMLVNKRSKRLGDFAGGTIVVREGRSPSIPLATVTEQRGYRLSSTDATLVRDFLLRRGSMNPRARAELGQRVATAMAQRYGLPLESDPERFLEEIA
jgi:uncharacterized RDD family membrane protein YckC